MIVANIGFPRTGTTSLKKALEILGIDNKFVGDHMCIPLDRYKTFDRDNPGAKFIFTIRKLPEIWYASVERWAEKHTNDMLRNQRLNMYGKETPEFYTYIDAYHRRYFDVLNYFKDNYPGKLKEKLLILCAENGDGFQKLCPFLGVDMPGVSYPFLNKNK